MSNYLKSVLKIGVGLAVARVAAAANGDRNLLSDKNLNNGIPGFIAGVYAVPKMKESLDKLVEGAAKDENPSLKRIATYAAAGSVAAALVYAIENGAHTKLVETASDLYKKVNQDKETS